MKTKRFILLVLAITTAGFASAATNDVSTLLQKGLFEEEANRNLDVAIQAYQSVITETDKNHKFAATAIFRLGECYRKQGKTNEATAQYQRILREFSDQTELANLSQSYAGNTAKSSSGFSDRLVKLQRAQDLSVEDQEIKRIQALIKESPDLINANTDGLGTPLNKAVNNGQLAVVKFLLENKANIESKEQGSGKTPLLAAADRGKLELVELLLSCGAEVNAVCRPTQGYAPGDEGVTALHLAVKHGYKSVAEMLLSHGANPSAQNSVGKTPLYLAAESGYKSVAELLLSHGAEVNVKASDGTTPLHAAVQAANQSIIELLLAKNADVNTETTMYAMTPLHSAASANQVEIAKLLLAHGAAVNAALKSGETPLFSAVGSGGIGMVRLLLAAKCDVNVRNKSGDTALLTAIATARKEIAQLLLDSGADVNAKPPWLRSPLHLAVEANSVELVKLILAHKPDLELHNYNGVTPLMAAINLDRSKITELLLDAGANVNAVYTGSSSSGCPGFSALEAAVTAQSKPMVELLLARKPDINWQDSSGLTALDRANSDALASPPNGRTQKAGEIAALLIKAGADENIHRLSVIGASRGEQTVNVFSKDTNAYNHYTLFELVNQFYAVDSKGWGFPDLNKVTIERLTSPSRQKQKIKVALGDLLEAGDCFRDVQLEWGDVVEFTEADHKLSEKWGGLPKTAVATLQKCATRSVEISVRGQKTKHVLYPGMASVGAALNYAWQFTPLTTATPATKLPAISSCRLKQVVFAAQVILSSSDLSRVKVIRTDAVSKKVSEMVFDLTQTDGNIQVTPLQSLPGGGFAPGMPGGRPGTIKAAYDPNTDLWLRDGDVIEIPEKP
ncbi:MAG: Ankyrin repeat-like protein [Pedosphaera sp.]|nr:Ankyrin repeat-like protein [Pedosphaera sp.]